MRTISLRITLAAMTLLSITGCAGQSTSAPTSLGAPSPTIAAVQVQPARPTATPAIQAAPSNLAAGTTPQAGAPAAEPSIYLWPTYLPPNMQASPTESRVAKDDQTGEAGLGFYIITLNNGRQKISIGGGDLSDVLPLSGAQRPITAGARAGTLITSGDRREIVFNMARGKLFVYSVGLDEQDLLKIAASLQPIDVKTLRDLAGTT